MTAYEQESGITKNGSPFYDKAIFEDLKRADEIYSSGEASSYREAIRIVLGKHHKAIPPESVEAIENKLETIDQQIKEMKEVLERLSFDSNQALLQRNEQILSRIEFLLNQPVSDSQSGY